MEWLNNLNNKLKNNRLKRWEDRVLPKYEERLITIGNIAVYSACAYFCVRLALLFLSL